MSSLSQKIFLCTLAFLTVSVAVFTPARAANITTPVNVMTELTFQSASDHADPFNTVTLDAVVTTPSGAKLRVPAFWAGKNIWKVRYASPEVGTHHFATECNQSSDTGLHGTQGQIEVQPYTGSNPLYQHGPIRVAANKRHFEHADGKPFFWLGDTWWMGLCHRMQWPDDIHKLTADRKQKGFNVIQIVAGLYPDMHPFDPRGANEAGFPWQPEYAAIRPEYFDAADERLMYLVDQGFTPCIVGAWGYFMPWMGVEKMNQHWRYLIARYGAMPVVWCAAGEANLPWYLAQGFPYDDREQVTKWTEVMRYIRATDPYQRPLTIHPTGLGRLSARNAADDPTLLDFDLLQTPHAGREAVDPTVRTVQESYHDTPRMPVINGEAAYEMLGDSIPTKWTRQMFWLCMTNGAAGHTYGANGIWQCNRPGQPHGPSPHHPPDSAGYGKIPWTESMNLAGSAQVGHGKRLFEKYSWQKFTPHPEWATYASDPSFAQIEWNQWIWFPEGNPAVDAPVAKRRFRKTFTIDDPAALTSASLGITADDRFVAYINGQRIAENSDWHSPRLLDSLRHLRPGKNVIAIEAENVPVPFANPAGLLASLQLRTATSTHNIATDETWLCSNDTATDSADWTTLEFNDSSWTKSQELAPYGGSPWGKFQPSASYGPYATGIPGQVRIIYVPERKSVIVNNIEQGATYRVAAFDPQSGKTIKLGPFTNNQFSPDDTYLVDGTPVTIPATDDWVLILENID